MRRRRRERGSSQRAKVAEPFSDGLQVAPEVRVELCRLRCHRVQCGERCGPHTSCKDRHAARLDLRSRLDGALVAVGLLSIGKEPYDCPRATTAVCDDVPCGVQPRVDLGASPRRERGNGAVQGRAIMCELDEDGGGTREANDGRAADVGVNLLEDEDGELLEIRHERLHGARAVEYEDEVEGHATAWRRWRRQRRQRRQRRRGKCRRVGHAAGNLHVVNRDIALPAPASDGAERKRMAQEVTDYAHHIRETTRTRNEDHISCRQCSRAYVRATCEPIVSRCTCGELPVADGDRGLLARDLPKLLPPAVDERKRAHRGAEHVIAKRDVLDEAASATGAPVVEKLEDVAINARRGGLGVVVLAAAPKPRRRPCVGAGGGSLAPVEAVWRRGERSAVRGIRRASAPPNARVVVKGKECAGRRRRIGRWRRRLCKHDRRTDFESVCHDRVIRGECDEVTRMQEHVVGTHGASVLRIAVGQCDEVKAVL